MLEEIVIVAGQRTPLGGFQGCLSSVTAPQLGAAAIRAVVTSAVNNSSGTTLDTVFGTSFGTSLDNAAELSAMVDEVYMGCVLAAGTGQAPARQAALAAGLSASTSCTTVNKVCGSGMKAIMMAADQLQLGRADMVIAGGMESMSNAPYLLDKARSGYRMGHQSLLDHMFLDGLQDAYDGELMGVHAQSVADEYAITRTMMDDFTLTSLARAQHAINQDWFVDEIAPVTVKNKKTEILVQEDEQPSLAKPEKIPLLRPAFTKDGSITAANASSIADGAAALLMTRRDKAEALGLRPIARIVDYVSYGHQPEHFTSAPVGAIKKLLSQQQLMPSDIDLVEINEAFAMVSILGMQEIGFTAEQTNVAGGACALGHPLGASGCRIVVTLLHNLMRQGKKRGLAALCIGGGEATAMLIEVI
ncbi:MAG: acetyl-CoA C-acetyltransferase [Candidatus Endobugula sp.]|jgi:acetyl-CoA C-acetyltransferase